jgi:hypothetical protein
LLYIFNVQKLSISPGNISVNRSIDNPEFLSWRFPRRNLKRFNPLTATCIIVPDDMILSAEWRHLCHDVILTALWRYLPFLFNFKRFYITYSQFMVAVIRPAMKMVYTTKELITVGYTIFGITVGCPLFLLSILIAIYLFTGSLKNRSIHI